MSDIQYIVSTDAPENPLNSTGKDLALVVNTIIDLTGALIDRNSEPPINPDVNTYTAFNNNISYSFGDEIRTPKGYFRAIQDIPVNPGYGFANMNAWLVFYVPNIDGKPFAGLHTPGFQYPKGVYLAKIEGSNMRVLRTVNDIEQGSLFVEADFVQEYSYTL
ncbi:hypothetical protein CZP2022_72 [Vibrio phage C-ZP2022]|nr:hypothetical protein CZP2022_72 [Vibrio phage C-ZP2022]